MLMQQRCFLEIFVLLVVLISLFGSVHSFVPLSTRRRQRQQQQQQPQRLSTDLYGIWSKLFPGSQEQQKSGNKSMPGATIQQALVGRRTVNAFETTAIPDDVVLQAIEAAVHAPCHKMTEPWRFILLGEETIQAIAKLNAAEIAKKDTAKAAKKQARWQAIPGWCVVTAALSPHEDAVQQQQEDYAATACAIQNFMLSLWGQGVGTKWTSGPITRTTEFAKLCDIDLEQEQVVGCIWYGYAAGASGLDAIPTPKRKKSVQDVLSRRP